MPTPLIIYRGTEQHPQQMLHTSPKIDDLEKQFFQLGGISMTTTASNNHNAKSRPLLGTKGSVDCTIARRNGFLAQYDFAFDYGKGSVRYRQNVINTERCKSTKAYFN
ncbi:hypothetical protein TSMEX_006545 [Taenia solium]|eukprot:TsM_001146600 transcript=TsM_001146600 gene=TsM_001146600